MSGKLTLLFLFGLVAFALAVPLENIADEKANPEVPSEEEVEADVPEEITPEEDETLESDAADDLKTDDEKAEDPLEDDKAEEETNDETEADEQNDDEEDDQENEVAESEDPKARSRRRRSRKYWVQHKTCRAKKLLCLRGYVRKGVKKCRVRFQCCATICRYRRVRYRIRRCVRYRYRYGRRCRPYRVCVRRRSRYVYRHKLLYCLRTKRCSNVISVYFRHKIRSG